MLIAIASIFALALVAPTLHRFTRTLTGWVLALVPAAIAIYVGSSGATVGAGNQLRSSLPWSPELGISLSFVLDGLSVLFVLLICGIGALVLVYSGGYLAGNPHVGRFYSFLLLFMGAMLGLVLADNILLLFLFWELTSISSYLLIGFTHQREESRAAAQQALLITGSGGLVLLIGLITLGMVGGSFELSVLLAQGDIIRVSPLYGLIVALVCVGAFTKSAQFPFHFWLPGAMEAPTPVSAYLHSATMVKAGIYLLARLSPMLNGTDLWVIVVSTVGAITMIVGGVLALYQTDLKRVLAYSTVSALGTLVLLLGIGTDEAINAAMVFLLAHALYKGALFMVAGIVDHETGTRNLEKLGGLRRTMPITTVIAVLAAVSLSGFGPIVTFIGKELILEAVLHVERFAAPLVVSVVISGALFTTAALIVGIRPFFGIAKPTPKHPHEAPVAMWLGPALLAVAGLVLGIFPNLIERSLVAGAISVVRGAPATLDLYLWHGFNIALMLSITSVVTGVALYFAWAFLRRTTSIVERVLGFWPGNGYRLTIDAINRLARRVTGVLQNGYLRYYILTILVTTVLFVGWTLVIRQGFLPAVTWTDVRFYEVALALLMLAAAMYAVVAPGRLSAVTALGIVGYGVALIYILYGAPDLAMTQILVETLTVILFVLVFYHMPRFQHFSKPLARFRDAIVSLSVGALMTVLILIVTATPPQSRLQDFYSANSKLLAHGSNIVNVILVDFRGMDTFGETVVLGVAAFGVFALLKLGRATPRDVSRSSRVLKRLRHMLRRRVGDGEARS